MSSLIAAFVFLFITIFRSLAYMLWNDAVRGTELRQYAKAAAWPLGVLALCYDIVFLPEMIDIAEQNGGTNLGAAATIAAMVVLLLDIVIVVLLFRDKDDDLFRDAFGKIKNKFKSALTLQQPRPVTVSAS